MKKRFLFLYLFMLIVSEGCEKQSILTVPKNTITATATVTKEIAISSAKTTKSLFGKIIDFFKFKKKESLRSITGKDNEYSQDPDYTKFLVDSSEEITKDIVENIVSGADATEYVTEITEDITQEACDHLF